MATCPNIAISFNSSEAIHKQIANHLRRQIAAGKMSPGDRLPAIRALATSLGLDPGTVARAYRELGQDGIISSQHGSHGSYVSAKATESNLTERQRERLGALVEKTVLDAINLGYSAEDVETAFTLQLASRRRTSSSPSTEPLSFDKANHSDLRFSGSHDLAVELLANHLRSMYEGARVITSFVGSLAGLIALERREADAHLLDYETNEFNVPFIKRILPNETVVLVNLVQRMQGLIVAPGNPKHVISILDLKRPDITFINRQKGSGTRILLDSQLRKLGIETASVKGYDCEENTHVAVATMIAQGKADVGLGAQSAASVARLDFIPLLKERYDLVILKESMENPSVQELIDVIHDDSFHKMLSTFPGYDLECIGEKLIVAPG
jgi:molybdate-binding protein/DNA-binding transcriptional regulator YhcF (GntR family)